MPEDYEPHHHQSHMNHHHQSHAVKLSYGRYIRGLFLAAALIMLVFLPYLKQSVPVPSFISLITILVITFLAGFTNRTHRWAIYLDAVVSFGGIFVFGYHAVKSFSRPITLFFVVNQVLAILFLIAFYLSVRTFRHYLHG
ncbi:hypothetical protein KW783_03675 [Candidatus Parcubacteria bacterium]|nr:hypothetical protein [Candidatus Parcubacteria bacterium]